MHIQFLGANETVTGSKTLVSFRQSKKKILVDCGLFQGHKNLRLKNWESLDISAQEIDAVVLTHAHLDHSGFLPVLGLQGFRGPIYCTPGTARLLPILLIDSAKIQEEDAAYANKKGFSKHKPARPLYTAQDVEKILQQIQIIPYDRETEIFSKNTLLFSEAGHIIGSASARLAGDNTSICFSGDLGRFEDAVMNPPAQIADSDYIVIESTYGNRTHSKEDPNDVLAQEILKVFKRGGDVLIPAFAVGRTQKVVYHIINLMNQGIIPRVPVYMDSPMAINASEIFCQFHKEHKLSRQNCELIFDKVIIARSQQDSMNIATTQGQKIIISASGMATGGRVLHHLRRLLPDSKSGVIFAGFQAGGTRGDKLVSGSASVKIHGKEVAVLASVANIDSLSAHGDVNELLKWIGGLQRPPKMVFLNHGEPAALKAFKERLEKHFPESEVHIPLYQQEYKL